MRSTAVLVTLLATLSPACAPVPSGVVGWKVDPTRPDPTESLLLITGPSPKVAEVLAIAGSLGWRTVDRAVSQSGSTFALIAGPTSLEANERIFDLIYRHGLVHGPAISRDGRFQPAG